jgi:hypothetical protein
VTAKVIYGKPEPEWSMEEKVEWLVARVVPMREELTAVREGLDETKGKLAVMSGELRDYVSTAIAESQRPGIAPETPRPIAGRPRSLAQSPDAVTPAATSSRIRSSRASDSARSCSSGSSDSGSNRGRSFAIAATATWE